MNRHPIMAELTADDRLLDRLAARQDAGPEPVASMLAALARHADLPLLAAAPPSRLVRRRALTALTALVVGASGVGVAAATGPDSFWPRQSHLVPDADAALPRTTATPPTLPAPTLPSASLATRGYALVRDAAGRIHLAPPRVTVFEVPAVVQQPEPAYAAAALVEEAPSQSVRADTDRPTRDEDHAVHDTTHVAKGDDKSPETKSKGNGGGHPVDDPEAALTLSAIAPEASPAESPANAHVAGPRGQSGLEVHTKPKPVEAAHPTIPVPVGPPAVPATPAAPATPAVPATPGHATTSGDVVKPAEPIEPVEPADGARPGEDVKPAEPAEPSHDARPEERDEPRPPASPAPVPAVPDQPAPPASALLGAAVANVAGVTTP